MAKKAAWMKPNARKRPRRRSMRKARAPSIIQSSTASEEAAATVRTAAIGFRSKCSNIPW